MQEFNEGDLVEATQGEESHRQRLVDKLEGLWFRALNMSVSEAQRSGWTFTVIEKAAPKLPTGMYTAILARLKGLTQRRILFLYGEAWIDGDGVLHPASDITEFEIKAEPVPVTAKKVLERLANFWEFGPPQWMAAEIKNIAAEFGVTE